MDPRRKVFANPSAGPERGVREKEAGKKNRERLPNPHPGMLNEGTNREPGFSVEAMDSWEPRNVFIRGPLEKIYRFKDLAWGSENTGFVKVKLGGSLHVTEKGLQGIHPFRMRHHTTKTR